MKRVLALASLAFLAGCASDGYYGGYTTYRYYDDNAPYVYETYPSHAYGSPWYGSPSYYYYGAPAWFGGGIYYDGRDRREHRRDHRRDDRRDWRDDDRDDRIGHAPAERADPDNVVRPRAPGERFNR